MGKICIGLALMFFDYHIGTINIVPDFLGYFLVFLGMREFRVWKDHKAVLAGMVITAMNWGMFAWRVDEDFAFWVYVLITVITMSIQFLVTYQIAKGIKKLESELDTALHAGWVMACWALNTGLNSVLFVLFWVTPAVWSVTSAVGSVTNICYFAVCFMSWIAFRRWQAVNVN